MRHDDARLQTQRDDHSVRSAEPVGWQSDWRMPPPAPAPGVVKISAPAGPGIPRRAGTALGHGQLRHS